MTKHIDRKASGKEAYELLLAEEELILEAQMLIQRALNDRDMTQKNLAERLGVGESYISQMLGASARNLTLRTIARVLKALDAKATIRLEVRAELAASCGLLHDDAEPVAIASKVAATDYSGVWGDLVPLEPAKPKARRKTGEARAYAQHDPQIQEMAMAA